MARQRKFMRLQLPFLKRMKINKKTFFNVIGFILVAVAIILFLSFTQSGDILIRVNGRLTDLLGGISILFPILLMMVGSHFFNSKQVRIIKTHLTLGLFLIAIAVSGIFRAGKIGNVIFDNLKQDFSLSGAILILVTTFLIGTVIFFNTSIDVFLIFIARGVKTFFVFIKEYLVGGLLQKKSGSAEKNSSEELFIKDQKKPISTIAPTPVTHLPAQQNLYIKPLTQKDSNWTYPPLTLLPNINQTEPDRGDVKHNSNVIEKTLDSFGIRARVSEVNTGPTVTQYALQITVGTKLSKITAFYLPPIFPA